jgi:hypothetical protein
MKGSRPPVLATKLLEGLVSGPFADALRGDLIEHYRQGRSAAWFWRQVLVGVFASVVKDIGSHKLLAARSAVAGIVIYLLSSFPVKWLVHFLASHGWLRIESRLRIADLLGDLACIIIGWAVFTLSTRRQFTKVCLYSVAVFLFEAVHVSSGLVLDGRLSRVTSQILLLGVVLSITRPLSILVGGMLASVTTRPRLAERSPVTRITE